MPTGNTSSKTDDLGEPLLSDGYVLDEQIGFALRKAHQRHINIFTEDMGQILTPTQFSTLYRVVCTPGGQSQNALGRSVAMDAATTKGVVNRLEARGLILSNRDKQDRRRYVIEATPAGRAMIEECLPVMMDITEKTLARLTQAERRELLKLLGKIG